MRAGLRRAGGRGASPAGTPPSGTPELAAPPRSMFDFSPHEWRVLLPLVFAGFFENYDSALLTVAAPTIADGLGVSVATFGIGVAIIRLAALGSMPILRLADRRGRRWLLILSLAGFTLATGLSALAWSLAVFVVIQVVARVFLATEHALASLVIAEEVRADRRGAGLSLLGWLSIGGVGAVALLLLVVPLTPLDWRLLYLFALLPLGIVAYLRRNLRETVAFNVARTAQRLQVTLWPRVGPEHRGNLLRALAIVGAYGLVQTSGLFYASELAQEQYGWTGLFTTIVLVSGLFALIGFLLGGRASDRYGRKPLVLLGVALGVASTVLVFTEVQALFAPGFFLGVAATSCLQAVWLAYLAELFPTEVRATLTAIVLSWQIAAGSLGLLIVSALAAVVSPSATLIGLAVVVSGIAVLLRGLPETRGADVVGQRPGAA